MNLFLYYEAENTLKILHIHWSRQHRKCCGNWNATHLSALRVAAYIHCFLLKWKRMVQWPCTLVWFLDGLMWQNRHNGDVLVTTPQISPRQQNISHQLLMPLSSIYKDDNAIYARPRATSKNLVNHGFLSINVHFWEKNHYIFVPDIMAYSTVLNLYLIPRTTLSYKYYYQS